MIYENFLTVSSPVVLPPVEVKAVKYPPVFDHNRVKPSMATKLEAEIGAAMSLAVRGGFDRRAARISCRGPQRSLDEQARDLVGMIAVRDAKQATVNDLSEALSIPKPRLRVHLAKAIELGLLKVAGRNADNSKVYEATQ